MMDILHKAALSICPGNVNTVLEKLADESVEKAAKVANDPHANEYDNLNVIGSVHVEQRPDAPNKVRSASRI